jgi:ferrochelatase
MPFLENVLRGKNVPAERMREVAKHYEFFGGVSPINEQNRNLIAALTQALKVNGPQLSVYWGNRNWNPLLVHTLAQMVNDGIKNALAFVTSAYSSYSSCRQYLEDIVTAQGVAGPEAPRIDKIRAFYNHPLFIEANVENIRAALGQIPETRHLSAQIVFTAHSVPQSMAEHCEYEAQLQEASQLIAADLGHKRYRIAYQSRSGAPTQQWLGPDVCDYLRDLSASGTSDVLVAPIGFVSDHMEIIYDLDIEARQLCAKLGMNMVRCATVGTHPLFIKMIRELILERTNPNGNRRSLGTRGPNHDVCSVGCCLPADRG